MSQPKFYSASFLSEGYLGIWEKKAVCHLSIVAVELREIIAIYEVHQAEAGQPRAESRGGCSRGR